MNDNLTIEIHNRFDIIEARMQVRTLARKLGLDLFDQARISLAASTVAIILGLESSGNGTISMERRQFGERVGVEVVCTKADARLPNLAAGVMDDAKRMVDELTIRELPPHGIEVTLFKWGKSEHPGDWGHLSRRSQSSWQTASDEKAPQRVGNSECLDPLG